MTIYLDADTAYGLRAFLEQWAAADPENRASHQRVIDAIDEGVRRQQCPHCGGDGGSNCRCPGMESQRCEEDEADDLDWGEEQDYARDRRRRRVGPPDAYHRKLARR